MSKATLIDVRGAHDMELKRLQALTPCELQYLALSN